MYTLQLIIIYKLLVSKHIIPYDYNVIMVYGTKWDITSLFVMQVNVHQSLCFTLFKWPKDQLVIWCTSEG